jgi:hypothetical protein
MAKMPKTGIRLSPKRWINPMTSVAVDWEADLSAGRPTVKKNMSVPKMTAVLIMPTRDAVRIR